MSHLGQKKIVYHCLHSKLRCAERERDRERDRDRQTERDRQRETDRERQRETDRQRQTDRETYSYCTLFMLCLCSAYKHQGVKMGLLSYILGEASMSEFSFVSVLIEI
jgi:dihydroxyacetone kinase-like predicted kinase